ncbi:MAG: polysaccharide biosynthesis/export family protein, partial [Thermodesulfobacteriota bacterium]
MENKYFIQLFFIILIAGCSGGRSVNTQQYAAPQAQSPTQIKQINSQLSAKKSVNSASVSGYLIGPEDLLEVEVYETDKLNSIARVGSKGDVTLPLVGNIPLEGLTARQAEVEIANHLRNGGYVDNPNVTVFIRERNSKVVSVLGSVKQPGDYELLVNQTLIDTLSDAQGLSDDAGTSVQITRDEPDGTKT